MKLELPQPVVLINRILNQNGYKVYLVGGAVRDTLRRVQSHDWDFATNARPEEILQIFPDGFYDNKFGTVGVAGKHLIGDHNYKGEDINWLDEVFEITTFRKEYGYKDKRHPDKIVWGESIEDDLARRDFTINAMAIELIDNHKLFDTSEEKERHLIIDPFDGQKDLDRNIIRSVGSPGERFREDALRMIRAVRFGAQLGFTIEELTLEAIRENSDLIVHISMERISEELQKILLSPFPAEGIMLLHNTGLLQFIIPELEEGIGVAQAGRHIHDVWKHNIETLRECSSSDPIVRLAALIHDIGKPRTYKEEGPRGITFHGHEVVGASMAYHIAKRLKLSKKQTQKLTILVRWHMFMYQPEMTDASIRRFIKRVGLENINDMIALRIADRKGGGSKATSWRLREFQRRIGEQLYTPMSLRDLKINGQDVMEILDLPPSKKIGEILNTLFEEVMEDVHKNDREYLIKRIRELS